VVGTALIVLLVEAGLFMEALQGLFCLGVASCAWTLLLQRFGRRYAALGALSGLLLAGPLLLPAAAWFLRHVMPVKELEDAFAILAEFVGPQKMRQLTAELLIVTLNVQLPLGFLGIAFLRRAQDRMNALLLVGEEKLSAKSFSRRAVVYILLTAVPYIFQRTLMENVNTYAFGLFARDIERSMRLESFFPAGKDALLIAVSDSNFTVGGYSDAFNGVANTANDLVGRKLFSLPKLALLPGMLCSKPWLVVTMLPMSVLLDEGKSWLTALLSSRIEALSQSIQEVSNRRQQIEQHDTKHQELIRLNAVAGFAKARWTELSLSLSDLQLREAALKSVRSFIDWLYWQDMMQPGIECTLGFLLEMRHIGNVDIWVYSRVVEDAIDMLLTRSRNQAELATMQTNIERLQELAKRLSDARARGRMRCEVEPSAAALRFEDIEFSRGASLHVKVPQLVLPAGRVYAVTGPNGAGKSTAFAMLAGCGRQAMSLPAGVEIKTPGKIILPSDDMEVITQQLYCPLFVRPIDWILQATGAQLPPDVSETRGQEIVQLTAELMFHRNSTSGQGLTLEELREEKEDWYGGLSGGQRVKLEFIRKVFLREACPRILLLDEAFAPLDPRSKSAIQRRLKDFCAGSLILAIYHSDANDHCVSAGGFFDDNLHFENGTAALVGTC